MLGSREGSRLATGRASSYPGEKRASKASFIEVAEKNSRTFRNSKKGLKKLNVQQSEHFLEFLQNLLF